MPHVVVVVGHPRAGSRTHAVARQVGHLLSAALVEPGSPVPEPAWLDLAELAPALLADPGAGGAARQALRAIEPPAVLLVATPTFRGTYSGLLKLFLDLVPRYGLLGMVAVPLATAGIPAHRPLVDATLRPVLRELHADLPVAGISVLESELGRVDEVFDRWWARSGPALCEARRQEVTPC